MTNNKTEGVEDCKHEPIIDTGVGYYHCPRCNTGWTYAEWEAALSSFPSPPAGVEQRAKGGIWVKASERLPDETSYQVDGLCLKVTVGNTTGYYDDEENKWYYHNDLEIKGIDLAELQWLDETQSIAGSESQGQEAGWISVEEQKPDFDTPVFVWCRIYGRYIGSYNYIGDFNGEKFGNWHDGKQLGVLPPIFWMPLPPPPTSPK